MKQTSQVRFWIKFFNSYVLQTPSDSLGSSHFQFDDSDTSARWTGYLRL